MIKHALKAAQRAGAVIMEEYAHTDIAHLKDGGSPVTVADIRSNDVLIEHLRTTHIPIISEETESSAMGTLPECVWVVDPLDGTKDFIDRTTDFSVMIALVEHGEVVISVVYMPASSVLYYAERGKGAFIRDASGERRCTVSTRSPEGGRFVASAHHFSPLMQSVGGSLGSTVVRRGSNGVKGGLVAEGAAEYMFNEALLPVWDIAPVDLLVSEAGGEVTDIEGNILSYGSFGRINGIAASNGVGHAELIATIARLRRMS